jgi:predicted S18 family serine protease
MRARPLLGSLLALATLAALAAAETSMMVPAVDANGKGILTTITARAVPGRGDVYISVEPLISVETQQSEKIAVRIASEAAGVDRNQWDIFFKIVAPAESVDGPSGGAAMTVLTYAELTGRKPRKDLTVTGSIERDGRIGKIGGVLAKAEAVHEAGLKVFLVPLGQSVQDGVDIAQVAWERWKMTVVEVKDFAEVHKIAFAPEGSTIVMPQRVTQPLVLDAIPAPASAEPMRAVAVQEITDLETAYAQAKDRLTDLNRRAVEESLNTTRKLLQNRYYYSAANNAFVARLGISSFLNLNVTPAQFDRMVQEAEQELQRATFAPMTTENFEWVMAAQLRHYWARTRLAEVKDRLPLVRDPSFLLRDLASVQGWINASRRIALAAPTGGQPLDEGSVKEYARELLANVSEYIGGNPALDTEAAFHLEAAQLAYNESRYITATYDLYYAFAFYFASSETRDLTASEIEELVLGPEGLANETYTGSVWGHLFYAHSLFNLAEANRTGDLEPVLNAYRLQELAAGMSANRRDLLQVLQGLPPGATPVPTATIRATPAVTPVPTLEVTTTTEGDGLTRTTLLLLLVVAGAGVILLSAFILMRFLEHRPPAHLSPREALDRLDEQLVRGRISEGTYHRLRAKYERQAGGQAPARKGRR